MTSSDVTIENGEGLRDLTQSTRALLDVALSEHRMRRSILALLLKAMDLCADKPIRDRVVYNVLIQALEGAVIQLHNLGDWTIKFLKIVRAGRLSDFDVSKRSLAPQEDQGAAIRGDKVSPEARLEEFRRLFKVAAERGAKRPNGQDVDVLVNAVTAVVRPINEHRDQFVAHWDERAQAPATFGDLLNAVLGLEAALVGLWVVHTGENHLLPAQSPNNADASASALAELVLR